MERLGRRSRRSGYREATSLRARGLAVAVAVAAVVLVVPTYLLADVVVSAVLAVTGAGEVLAEDAADFAVDTAHEVLLVASALAYLRFRFGPDPSWVDRVNLAIPGRGDWRLVAAGLVAVLAVEFGGTALYDAAGVPTASSGHESTTPALFVGGVLVTVLFQAPAEELLFRRVVLDRFAASFGVQAAVAAAAVAFAVPHAFSYSGPGLVPELLQVFLAGLVLGGVYVRADNLLVPVVVHAGYNVTLDVLVQVGAIS